VPCPAAVIDVQLELFLLVNGGAASRWLPGRRSWSRFGVRAATGNECRPEEHVSASRRNEQRENRSNQGPEQRFDDVGFAIKPSWRATQFTDVVERGRGVEINSFETGR
jgi:hypothetical protein